MATSVAFSQDKSVQNKKSESASTKEVIKSVIPNLAHHSISVTLANIDPQEDYHILLYNSEKELISTYWVDGNEMTLAIGSIAANNYELVLLKGNEVVDKKEMLLQ
jgi:hypothetical protein